MLKQPIVLAALLLGVFVASTFAENEANNLGDHASRTVVDLNFEWRFKRLDIVNDVEASPAAYDFGPEGLEAVDYDDATWQRVDLPHDWAIDAGYAEDNLNRDRCGYVQGGIGWYRKTIDVPDGWQGRRVWLEFDGAFRKTAVWINGTYIGQRPYGWVSFGFDISDAIAGKRKATIAVRLNNSFASPARWYTGSGISRQNPPSPPQATQGDGLQRRAHGPQPSNARVLSLLRRTGPSGDGRDLRRLVCQGCC